MKLSKKLPQFKNVSTFIVVSAWQSGKIFYVLDGEIAEIDKLVVPNHKYSDKEGHSETRVRAGITSFSGAVLEDKKGHIRKEFLTQFVKRLNKLVLEFSAQEIYLFTPSRGVYDLDKKISARMRKMIKKRYLGNYIKFGPAKLVEIIGSKKLKPVSLMSEEARKILGRG